MSGHGKWTSLLNGQQCIWQAGSKELGWERVLHNTKVGGWALEHSHRKGILWLEPYRSCFKRWQLLHMGAR